MAAGNSLLKVTNIIAFVLTVAVNGLAGSTTVLGGKNTAQISDANPTLITPAGYVFSIWGVIYILLGVFVVYQALPNQQGKDFQKRIGWLFVLSSIVNIAWLFLWQFELLTLSVSSNVSSPDNTYSYLSPPWNREVHGFNSRKTGCSHTLQRLPWLDHNSLNRKRIRCTSFIELGWFRNKP